MLFADINFGPVNSKALLSQPYFVHCYSNKISSSDFIIWKINGTFYEQFHLPQNFYQQSKGLFIHETENNMNATKLQCYIHSNLLYKNSYWSSDTAILTVNEKTGKHYFAYSHNLIEYFCQI